MNLPYKKSLLLLIFFGITTFAAHENNKENIPLCKKHWMPHWTDKWQEHAYIVETYKKFLPELATLKCNLGLFTVTKSDTTEQSDTKKIEQTVFQCQKCHYTINLFQEEVPTVDNQEKIEPDPSLLHLCKFAKLQETVGKRSHKNAFIVQCCGDYSHTEHKGCKKKYVIMFK